ncbi:MAG: endonuclease III [Nitrospirae bacterium]|nr:MAG: endonuclease III [Nitrospirota bacterium]
MPDTKKILKSLFKKYPNPKIALRFSNPLELLVATILSAQCTDERVNRVTDELFKKYRTAEDYAHADIRTFEEEIRPTGFFRNKAKQVIGCCQAISERFGGKVPDNIDDLTTLPGVGRKTANVVLGSAFGKQAIAVDTHVLRVTNRLGLSSSKNPDRVEEELMEKIPGKDWTRFTLATILHGRETCKARNPLCGECVLYELCGWEGKK